MAQNPNQQRASDAVARWLSANYRNIAWLAEQSGVDPDRQDHRCGGIARAVSELTNDERAVLELERSWFKFAGAKDAEIRERFGISPTRYYQVLNALLDRPEALAADPTTVRRLQRQRAARRALRAKDRPWRAG